MSRSRPLSIFEQFTSPVIPPPDQVERQHLVKKGEFALSIANVEYGHRQYDENTWRDLLIANGVEDPRRLDKLPQAGGRQGQLLRIPPRPLPDFDL
jgi:hypothetical protein